MKRALWPMSTARGVALLRAIEMQRPEAERISADPHARRFVDALTLHGTRAMIATGLSNVLGLEGMMNFAIVRERHVEELMAREAAAGLDQIVILGAGFDTRSYRLTGADRIPIYEVDHPVTQAAKRKALRGVVEPPVNVRFVTVNFDVDDLDERLRACGYDPDGRTLFVWQGVIMYLTPEGIDHTLRFVAERSAPGSVVVFDYMYESLLRRLRGPTAMRLFTRAMGEDITFGIDGDKVESFLTSRGFDAVDNVDGAELARRYLTGKNARRPMARDAGIVAARVR
ncbi:MAG TPA: SAM-dependent methyltransferase [Reyranella sp.]|jgi:methyltransferase (TIGR00027 family)|nr:SAM-dependent methyltransferase [Reyranella sp.]